MHKEIVPLLTDEVNAKKSKAPTSPGVTYYLNYTEGSDDNEGLSPDKAWKTLDKVNEKNYLPGESILFKSGEVWEGELNPKGNGVAGNRIVIGSYGLGKKPVIHGNGANATISFKNQQHWEISNLEITNQELDAQGKVIKADSPRRGIYIYGENFGLTDETETNLNEIGILRDFYIHDMSIHDVWGQDEKNGDGSAAIQVSVRIPNIADDHASKDGSVNRRTTFDGIKIENNIIRDVDRSGIIFWTDWKNRDLLRYHPDISMGDKTKTPWTPITNVHIKGNKLYNIGGDGIAPHMSEGALVEYNFINGYNVRSTGYNAGMWLWNGDNALFQFNEATGGVSTRDGMPWDFDQGTQGIIYQYNYSYNNEGGTLLFCTEDEGEGVRNGVFRYNLSYNDKYQLFTICGGSALKDVNVYNNVFYVGEGMATEMMVSQGGAVEVEIFNNVFVNLGTGKYSSKPSWTYHNNAFFGNNIPNKEVIPDPFLVTEDPQFLNTSFPGTVLDKDMDTRDITDWSALDNFRVKETSPLVNKGRFISLDTVTHPGKRDFFGNALYNGQPDIGIHECSNVKYEDVKPFIPETPKS